MRIRILDRYIFQEVASTFLFSICAFTAVFVGRAIFKRPNVIGTFLGALLLQMMSNGIILIGKPYYVGDLITSILLIIALLISVLNDHEDKGVKEKPVVKETKGEEADAA